MQRNLDSKKKRILVTGGGGFIGSHFVEYLLEKTDWEILVGYRKNKNKIPDSTRIWIIQQDLENGSFLEHKPWSVYGQLDYIIHMAAETNVDDSLKYSSRFVSANVLGTANLLEWAKVYYPKTKICMFSSDEVMGPAPKGVDYKENDQRKPSNPYAATKGAAELLAYSFAHSFGMPIFVVRCMNVYGERQAPQKFISKVIKNFMKREKIQLHGTDPSNVASRHWVHAKDCADAVLFLLDKAQAKEIYHITGEERDVYYLAELIYKNLLFDPFKETTHSFHDLIEFVDFHKARPGHDKRYSLAGGKLQRMGWCPKFTLRGTLPGIVKREKKNYGENI